MAKIDTQMVWAGIEFSAYGVAVDKISVKNNYKYSEKDLLGNPAILQAICEGVEKLTVTGRYSTIDGPSAWAIEAVKSKAAMMNKFPLVTGRGVFLGEYVCTSVSYDHNDLLDDLAPTEVTFSLNFSKEKEV